MAKKKESPKKPGRPRTIEKLITTAQSHHKVLKLSVPVGHRLTRGAQKHLDAALDTVNSTLLTMVIARKVDKTREETDHRGRLAGPQVDILRAALVFAGAGVDAVLKRLIRDTIGPLCASNDLAQTRFSEFVTAHLQGKGAPVNLSNLARALINPAGSDQALIEAYEKELVGSSLQSVEEIDDVCSALGISDSELRKRTSPNDRNSELRQVFVARNEIIHELDLTGKPGRRRKHRSLERVRDLCREALEVTQLIVNTLGRDLKARGVN